MDPRPCVSVPDLWAWQPPGGAARQELCVDEGDANLPHHPTAVPPIEKMRKVHTPERQPQLLVCHDYKGDFPLCDRWDGCLADECEPFLFTHWWHMDTFCYFGHKMVTIPPPAYTSLAHRHGVRVLGTLIFENDSGKEALTTILSTDANMRRTIDKLVQIMKTWQFEGWLVNVEVELEVREVPMLTNFVGQLQMATKAANPQATTLWYDAVCTDGRLEWQNTINARNRDFYHAADAIFLNYAWKAADLDNCKFNRGAATVCVGIDVWGRSGGSSGWDCHEAVSKIFRKGLSVALFAPGWAVEADVNKERGISVEDNCNKFWSQFSSVMNSRPLDFFPFKTQFRNGFSKNGKFFRLRDMDLMPHLAHSKKQLIPTEHGLLIKTPGRHLLWVVKMQSNADLRVMIKVEGDSMSGNVKIKLDWREMKVCRYLDVNEADGVEDVRELRPMTNECLPVKAIFIETSEPRTVLSYFSAYHVDTKNCLS